jgi:hypothetical protein
VSIVLTTLAAAQVARGQDGAHYYYFDKKIPLSYDTTRIAVFEEVSSEADSAPLSKGLPSLGIEAAAVAPSGIANLQIAWVPGDVKDAAGIRALVARAADLDSVRFSSPVFLDGRGNPVIISPYLLVGFQDDVTQEKAQALLAETGSGAGSINEEDWSKIKDFARVETTVKDGLAVLDFANRLAERPEVKYAEPDMIMTARKSLIPDDPYFPNLWGLHNTGQSGGTVDMDMDGPEAWDISVGDPGIVTVIIDDGVQQDHPDINQIAGRDFTSAGTDGGPGNQCDNHGTTVAGCTSAIINNGLGVVGIAPGARVASAKYSISNVPCDGSGWFYISWFVNALDWAQTIGARVTNCSSGFGPSSSITNKYQETYDNGIVHFSSSGNSGGSGIGYPSSLPTVNSVGAINRYGNRAYFSTYGTGLAFVAPGQTIGTTDRTGSAGYFGGDYGYVDGTSYSSPYAAGVAAMVLSVNSSLMPAEVNQIMNDTCMDRGAAGYDIYYGWGIVNAHDAMVAASPGVLLEGHCFYDEAMQNPANSVTVDVANLDTGANWPADTLDNYYSLELQAGSDLNAGDTLRLIAKDDTNWVNVTDHVVTQPEIDAGSIYLDLILDEFYLDLVDFPMYEAEAPDEDQMCGPAVAQMVLNYMYWDADEDPVPPMTFDSQQELYDYGIVLNETPGIDYLDTVGMWHTIQDQRPLPYSQYGYNFSKRHNIESAEMVKQIAQWIAYEIGTYGGLEPGHPEHVPGVIPTYGNYTNWMAVRGIHTSEDAYPLPPELDVYGFWINDPYPASLGGIGENSYKTIDQFLLTYYLPLATGDSYDGEYVAICEPPENAADQEVVYITSPIRFTAEALAVIDAVQALENPPTDLVAEANQWVIQAAVEGVFEQLIPYDDAFAKRFEGLEPGTPLFIVNELGADYYAVPFNVPLGSASISDSQPGTAAVVIIDGAGGAFKEASWVKRPVPYLPISKAEALKIVWYMLEELGIDPIYVRKATAELVHVESTPYYPHWRITGPGFQILVAQDGTATVVE